MATTYVEVRSAPAWPMGLCANCGASDTLRPHRSRLVKTDVAVIPGLFVGDEKRMEIELPSCSTCTRTLGRLRPTISECLVVWGGIALLTLFAMVIPIANGVIPDQMGFVCGGPVVIATILTAAWYGTRRPRVGTTSYYQPVFLRAASSDGAVLGFTNSRYASEFTAANVGSRSASAVRYGKLVEQAR